MSNLEIEKTELSDDQLDQVAGGAMRNVLPTNANSHATTNASQDTTSSTDTSATTNNVTTTMTGDGTTMTSYSPPNP